MNFKDQINMRFLFVLLLLTSICFTANAQVSNKGIAVEAAGTVFFNSMRLSSINGEQGIYKEAKVSYRFEKPFEVGVVAGHQWRSYIYYRITPRGYSPLFMQLDFMPVALNFRVYLTDYFVDHIRLFKRREKWDVYNQIMLVRMYGKDTRDRYETAQDNIVYLYPYVHEYGRTYVGYMAGLAYRPTPHTAVFLEGGDGALATLQIGIRAKL